MKTLHIFDVFVELPRNCSVDRMQEYIDSAIKNYVGSLDPKDPVFNLNQTEVGVYYRGPTNIQEREREKI